MDTKATFNYNPIGSFIRGDPFTIAFVYPSLNKPFILKGGVKDIEAWLDRLKEPAIVHRTYWRHGRSRKSINVINIPVSIIIAELAWHTELWEREKISKKKKWAIIADHKVIVAMKRLPRKWVKELNPYIPKEYVNEVLWGHKSFDKTYPETKWKLGDYRLIRMEE